LGRLVRTPRRVQQRRTKGWQKPDGAISVARPHKWGNPFEVGKTPGVRTNADAVELYRMWLPGQHLYHQLSELTGHDLMCFCPLDQPCHADVLLELAKPMTTATATLNTALITMASRGSRPRCADPIDHQLWTSEPT
jgi:hypothetical protein